MTTETLTIITPAEPLNAIVARYPQTLPILQRFGLDTCCGGSIPLGTAAEHHGLDLDELIGALREAAEEQA
jgi:regulator of cell morphogenesis and NO signaling